MKLKKEIIKKIRENGLPNNLRPFCGPTAEASNEKSSKLLIGKSDIQTNIRAIISFFSHENIHVISIVYHSIQPGVILGFNMEIMCSDAWATPICMEWSTVSFGLNIDSQALKRHFT